MNMNTMKLPVILALTGTSLFGCGATASITAAQNKLAAALATVGVSSPSASGSSSAALLQSVTPVRPQTGFTPTEDIAAGDVKSVGEKVDALVARLDATTAASCVAGLNVGFKNRPNLKCFGSQYAVSSTYALAGATFNPNSTVTSGAFSGGGSHPGGDSGMLVATEPSTGEACASATTNAYVSYAAQGVSISQDLFAAGLCLANLAGKDLPADGETLDLLATVGTDITAVTFTTFSLSKGTDGYTLTAAGSSASKAFNITSVNSKTGTTDAGKVYGYYETDSFMGANYFSFIVSYSKTDADASIEYQSARTTGHTAVNATTSTLDYALAGNQDMFFIKLQGKQTDADVDGSMLFAWQAGSMDSHARVFQSSVEGATGEAYFGYGPNLTDVANLTHYGEITGMVCDWALTTGGSTQSHVTQASTTNVNKAEKQTFTLTAGKFIPTVNNISYAPHDTCNGHGSSSADNYTMGVGTDGGVMHSFTAHAFTGSTWPIAYTFANDLVTISAGLGIPTARRP